MESQLTIVGVLFAAAGSLYGDGELNVTDLRDRGNEFHGVTKIQSGDDEILQIQGGIWNAGEKESGKYEVHFYLTKTGVGDGFIPSPVEIELGDIAFGVEVINETLGDRFSAIDVSYAISRKTPAGEYRLKWYIDGGHEVSEADEEDNVILADAPSFQVHSKVDLDDRSFIFHSFSNYSVGSGAEVTIEADIINRGNTDASSFKVHYYLSHDDQIDPDSDTFLGEKTIAGLDKGDFIPIDHVVAIPVSLPEGDYRVGWVIDPDSTSVANAPILPGTEPPVELEGNNIVIHDDILHVEGIGFEIVGVSYESGKFQVTITTKVGFKYELEKRPLEEKRVGKQLARRCSAAGTKCFYGMRMLKGPGQFTE